MARRGGAWRRLMESTEGPTVTLSLPREWAEELLRSLMGSLEMGDDDGFGDPDLDDMGGMEPDLDDMGGPPDGDMDDMGLGMDDDGGELDFAAGEPDDDEDDEPAPPKKRGPGRPPGKSKKKAEPKDDDDSDSDESDDDDDDEKDEAVDFSRGPTDGFRAGTAVGESAYARAARAIASGPSRRR